MHAIVVAAGEGRRLRPITARWPKAILPIDGRPVVASLLGELAAADLRRVWLVVGRLGEQIETLLGGGDGYGVDVAYVRQPGVLGSADAVARALRAGAELPALVVAADTVFRHGDIEAFVAAFHATKTEGAIAVRRDPPPGPARAAVRVLDGLVARVHDEDPANTLSGAPLWALGGPVADRLCRDREPFELSSAFQAAIDAGAKIAAVEIGKTRDLTDPVDVVEENFPYLKGLSRS
jgi:UDP-N-acetylglucosamine diphosphorylase / glucose-1-phosphate thymidylyltransferase / UDP-N-acetylgalactosamine diphosphorylase / glucosamine-1-phosphate N-acetyltransferase / galactosamine-1-phosphate N-acetyltransferase